MALAISGLSRVRRSSSRMRSNQLPERCASRPCSADQVEHLPVALAGEHEALRLLGGGLRRVEVGDEEGVVAPRQQDVGVVVAAVGLEPVERGGRRLAGRPTSPRVRASRARSRGAALGVGALERLAVGRRRPSGRRWR